MNLEFDASFLKFLKKNRDLVLAPKIERILLDCEKAPGIDDIRNCKKLTGFTSYFIVSE